MRITLAAGLGALLAAAALTACGTDDPEPSDIYGSGHVIALIHPKGGETFKPGDTVVVKWKTKSDLVNSVDVRLSPNNGQIWGILPHINGSVGSTKTTDAEWGNFKWVVPEAVNFYGTTYSLVGSELRMRVEQYSTGDTALMAETKTSFTVLP